MTNSYQENRSRIIFIFVIVIFIAFIPAVQAQSDSLKAIKLSHPSFASLRESEPTLYLPYATTFNLQQPTYTGSRPYYNHLYTPPKLAIGGTIFNVVGIGVLSVFGENNGHSYQHSPGQWQ